MLTARRHRLIPVVHAVDDGGSLCGARPLGAWVPNHSLPVSCPRCLIALSRPRYAFCRAPGPAAGHLHVRLVGPEGVTRSGGPGKLEALCGVAAGWDLELVGRTPGPDDKRACRYCVKALREARTGLPDYT